MKSPPVPVPQAALLTALMDSGGAWVLTMSAEGAVSFLVEHQAPGTPPEGDWETVEAEWPGGPLTVTPAGAGTHRYRARGRNASGLGVGAVAEVAV